MFDLRIRVFAVPAIKKQVRFVGRLVLSLRLVFAAASVLLCHQSAVAVDTDGEPIHLTDGGSGTTFQLDPVNVTGTMLQLDPVHVKFGRPGNIPGFLTNANYAQIPAEPRGSEEPGPANPSQKQADKPSSNGNTSPSKCSDDQNSNPSTGNPVIIATGEKYKAEQDFGAGSSYGLSLGRTYRSFNATATMFGPKWLSEYDYAALNYSGCYHHPDYGNLCIPQQAVFTLPDGSTYTYTRTSSYGGLGYKVKNSSAMGSLVYDPYGGWTLNKDKKTYAFSPTGVIQRIASKGNATLLQYVYGADPYRPIRVVNGPRPDPGIHLVQLPRRQGQGSLWQRMELWLRRQRDADLGDLAGRVA